MAAEAAAVPILYRVRNYSGVVDHCFFEILLCRNVRLTNTSAHSQQHYHILENWTVTLKELHNDSAILHRYYSSAGLCRSVHDEDCSHDQRCGSVFSIVLTCKNGDGPPSFIFLSFSQLEADDTAFSIHQSKDVPEAFRRINHSAHSQVSA